MIVSQLHELVYSEYVAPSATQDSPTEEVSGVVAYSIPEQALYPWQHLSLPRTLCL